GRGAVEQAPLAGATPRSCGASISPVFFPSMPHGSVAGVILPAENHCLDVQEPPHGAGTRNATGGTLLTRGRLTNPRDPRPTGRHHRQMRHEGSPSPSVRGKAYAGIKSAPACQSATLPAVPRDQSVADPGPIA